MAVIADVLLGHHHLYELLVVDLSVTVNVRLAVGAHVSWPRQLPNLSSLQNTGLTQVGNRAQALPMHRAKGQADHGEQKKKPFVTALTGSSRRPPRR